MLRRNLNIAKKRSGEKFYNARRTSQSHVLKSCFSLECEDKLYILPGVYGEGMGGSTDLEWNTECCAKASLPGVKTVCSGMGIAIIVTCYIERVIVI